MGDVNRSGPIDIKGTVLFLASQIEYLCEFWRRKLRIFFECIISSGGPPQFDVYVRIMNVMNTRMNTHGARTMPKGCDEEGKDRAEETGVRHR